MRALAGTGLALTCWLVPDFRGGPLEVADACPSPSLGDVSAVFADAY